MLQALRISNFAVIEEAEFQVEAGLTVLTGETGAGKSILIDALGLLLGGRGDADLVRAGCEEAVVEGIFRATPALRSRLVEKGYPDLGEEVQVRRVLGRNGRGKAYLNGSLVTVGVLTELMRGLVDIAGQHEHTRLLDPTSHGNLLDQVGGLSARRERYRADFDALRSIEGELTALGGDARQIQDRVEFLRFQLQELERLELSVERDSRLEEERRRLSSIEKLRKAAHDAEAVVSSEEGSALERVERALCWVQEGAKLDPALAAIAESLRSARAELDEGGRALARYLGSSEGEPRRLEELHRIEERLDLIRHLCRKHATDLEGLLGRQSELGGELERLENREASVAALCLERERREAAARASAELLSRARAEAAVSLAQAVRSGLAGLALGKSGFEVRLTRLPSLTASGQDGVELYFNANPGEPLRPLAKVASGGEAARLLLALKRSVAGADGCGCYVLDEADAGVGGAVAEVVGRMVKELSLHCQVLCITHSPQVAAYAENHWVVEKVQRGGRTRSKLSALETDQERTGELARMLSGVEVTREALGAAEALVRSARRSARASKRPAPARSARLPQKNEPAVQSAGWGATPQIAEA